MPTFAIYSGELKSGGALYNSIKKKRERVTKILLMHANKRTELQVARAGDIVAVSGLKDTSTGETLCVENKQIIFDLMEFPDSVISIAIEPKTSADEKKLLDSLNQLRLEDPSFTYSSNKETGQLLIYGMGELHLEIVVDRLRREFKVDIRVGKPQVSYRESISGSATEAARFNREEGERTQFGQASIRVESTTCSTGVEFVSEIPKRDLPKEIIAAIKRGVLDSAPGGVLAGYPFINIKATLVSAQYNELEACEVAYAIAASQAFKMACQKSSLRLLEPVMSLEVVTPTEYTGEVIADINMKRGRILSMGSKQNKEQIIAEVPLAEMFGYSTDLRSKSQGRGSFTMTFAKYEVMDMVLAKKILETKGIFI